MLNDFLDLVREEANTIAENMEMRGEVTDKELAQFIIHFAVNLLDNVDDRQRVYTGPNYPLIQVRSAQLAAMSYFMYMRYKNFTDETEQLAKYRSEWFRKMLTQIKGELDEANSED